MKNLESHIAAVRTFVSLIRDESLATIDFDTICTQLDEVAGALESYARMRDELVTLRRDVSSRISGMARATAVARGTHRDLETVEQLDERLPRMSAGELVRCYHRVAARFRDTFPASMSAVTSFGRAACRRRDELSAPSGAHQR